MANGIFITGTDTGVGKTYVASRLMKEFQAKGQSVVGYKPIASEGEMDAGLLKNSDALALQRAGSVNMPYSIINPYCFEDAIAPHIAANREGVVIKKSVIQKCYEKLAASSDRVVVEGAGGWLTPLNAEEGIDCVAKQLDLDVVLVVGVKLGCINHALLTDLAIKATGCRLIGWVANCLDENFQEIEETIATMKQTMSAPCVGKLTYQENSAIEAENNYINIRSLLD